MISRFRQWLRPVVYLSNNPISLIGVVLVTSAAVSLIALLPLLWSGAVRLPYGGILFFLGLPAVFFLGLALIPLGMWLRRKRGDYVAALELIEQALKGNALDRRLRRKVSDMHLLLARAHVESGHLDEARQQFQAALDLGGGADSSMILAH